ncbi:beta-ketoacyl synthase N-terminal-like domain-containing protein [Ancylobacter sp. WKF20]|uniref:thiolase family protein n=1 Tax=Ancylobacter sp. WKF20 TaxID=3039801 RepID=UPI00243431CE|nr:beta-ketoacyl synthase N-terminal-like domain-containing protein [Ancylobacter sp. WKF20]WGD28410.1 beta-ketoacyl synthase N-terminal-like domain-containing protein [Ancylobacter sp. WKF20]
MSGAYVLAARRTAVAPRRGAFNAIEAHDLAAPVLRACLQDAGIPPEAVGHVILGNALSGGGNVARLSALAAGIPAHVPALTLDTQCCSGLDAIALGARLVASGAAEIVLAGGVESWSRAPLRARRPREAGEAPAFYERPPFSPFPDADPDMLEAMAALAVERGYTRAVQHGLAVDSHAKARAARDRMAAEIVAMAGLAHDAFTRDLTHRLAARAPLVAGEGACALDATTVAVEADAAAGVLIVSAKVKERLGLPSCIVAAAASAGGVPERPYDALVPAVRAVLDQAGSALDALAVLELMEASAPQLLENRRQLDLRDDPLNRGGGALARGHPVGASGAILAVRLFHELARETPGALGLAAIAAAGGLGSALMLQRS